MQVFMITLQVSKVWRQLPAKLKKMVGIELFIYKEQANNS